MTLLALFNTATPALARRSQKEAYTEYRCKCCKPWPGGAGVLHADAPDRSHASYRHLTLCPRGLPPSQNRHGRRDGGGGFDTTKCRRDRNRNPALDASLLLGSPPLDLGLLWMARQGNRQADKTDVALSSRGSSSVDS